MKFSTGLLIGFGVGYVLGSKAGRERYEQLQDYYRQAERRARDYVGDERVDAWTQKTQDVYSATSEKARGVMSSGLDTASKTMRNVADADSAAADAAEDAVEQAAGEVLEVAPDTDSAADGSDEAATG